MLELQRSENAEELFLGLDKRKDGKAIFYRAPGYNEAVGNVITRFYAEAKKKGAVLTGKLSNPDEGQLTYFAEMTGSDFSVDEFFIGRSVGMWLPQLSNKQCASIADVIYDELCDFKKSGKTDAMAKNLYVRLMCWLYYKLGGMLTHLGENEPPKVLYGGKLGKHELYLLSLLERCGCDVLLLLCDGTAEYDSLDPQGGLSKVLPMGQLGAYPDGFGIAKLEEEDAAQRRRRQLYPGEPTVKAALNVWLEGSDILEDIKRIPVTRGSADATFYNAFCRLTGVPDKLTYPHDLFKLYNVVKNGGRKFVLVEGKIPMPTNDELAVVDRSGFKTKEQLIGAMLGCIHLPRNEELRRLVSKAFIDVLLEESEREGVNPQRLTTMAACVACWLSRYLPMLFGGWTMPQVSLFIYFGGCKNGHESAFLRVLSRLPCDVLILVPNLNVTCQLSDPLLYELKYGDSLNMTSFPTEISGLQFGTAAYHAEKELDDALYNGTGLFRDYQYTKANSVVLKTMYEEIEMLWKEETKFRPNFEVVEGVVNVPVIFAKVSGVKDSQPSKYWKLVQSLVTDNTLVIGSVPYLSSNDNNPMRVNSSLLLRGGVINREAVLARREYQYRHLRPETQSFIFDKIDLLIRSRMIRGTFENGTEYAIAATLLFLPPAVLRLIQGFDFTKVNPKVLYINTGERPISLEDAILTAFLSLAGFDVLFMVPTGYQTVEGFFNKNILDEHKVGEYMYDLQVPKLKIPKPKPQQQQKNKSIFGNLFRKGN